MLIFCYLWIVYVFVHGNMILLQWQAWDDGEGQLFLLAADIGICCVSRYIYLAVFGAVWIHSEYIWVLQEFRISQYISKQDTVICSCQGTYSAAVYRKLKNWYQGLKTDVVLAVLTEYFGNGQKYRVWTFAFLSPMQDLSQLTRSWKTVIEHWTENKRLLPFVHGWTKDCFLSSKNEIEGSP